MAEHRPYYRKGLSAAQPGISPDSDGTHVDFAGAWPLGPGDPVAAAAKLFDTRAAAVVNSAAGVNGAGDSGPPRIWPVIGPGAGPPQPWFRSKDLLELKWYGDEAPTVYLVRGKCLALLAYADFFPAQTTRGRALRELVSRAILSASPGWCGTFGPGVDDTFDLVADDLPEGNYDMTQMFLLSIAYRHYADISPAAREHLITQLLARGVVHRPRVHDTFTSGRNPNDWARAGFVSPAGHKIVIGETENHILMILTARYLTNQLLFQRDPLRKYDNRRNGGDDYPACTSLVLALLRRILAGDFSEYNAKNYQSETRNALLNLCSFAYDQEVRLGARMALDYLSAHMAISSSDLRRLLPFRRLNKDKNSAHTSAGYSTVGLLAPRPGSDPMGPYFAVQSGQLRSYTPAYGRQKCTIDDPGTDFTLEALSQYRLPPAIHDLFVNDLHRRYFQRLHRTIRDEVGGNRNCDNMEIFAGSPSYLITAGGAPATYAIHPDVAAFLAAEKQSQQLGVAMPTSFMRAGDLATDASQLIQLGEFSRLERSQVKLKIFGQKVTQFDAVGVRGVANYGVAPDFACGHQIALPPWVSEEARTSAGFSFVDLSGPVAKRGKTYGFFLAIYQQTPGGLALIEAYDTWRPHADLQFDQFTAGVLERNRGLQLHSGATTKYVTTNLNVLEFSVWDKAGDGVAGTVSGATVLSINYGEADRADAVGRADQQPWQLLNGTIVNTPAEAVVVITNPHRGSTVTLDFSQEGHPRRQDSETGESEVAGFNNEVWLDFAYAGPAEGDVCRPFNTLLGAVGAVADGGTIQVVPGTTPESGSFLGKRCTLVAPLGAVSIGTSAVRAAPPPEDPGALSNRDVWVQLDWSPSSAPHPLHMFNSVAEAVDAVADRGVVHIQPGTTSDRTTIGGAKRCTLVAPLGGVTIGR